jgi:CDP-4-dehydro-6-deoxyglucose reductase
MKPRRTIAKIEQITPLTDNILQLILKPNAYIEYQAGQYLQIISAKDAISYSIANAPLGSHKYELHIRHSRDNISTQALLAEIKHKGTVSLQLPFGECELSRLDPIKPIIFIAGGTGFAPIKAMIEQLLAEGAKRPFELFWGARSQSDLYLEEEITQWQKHVNNFQYFSFLSEESHSDTLSSMVFNKHVHDIHNWQIVISGPFNMVYGIRDTLVAHGVAPDHLFSDAFSFEPKE